MEVNTTAKTRIVMVRHGEPSERFGAYDPGLSLLGMQQAQCVAAKLRNRSLTCVVVGPSQRTLETGREIAKSLEVPLIIQEAFAEVPIKGCSASETRELVRRFFDSRWEDVEPGLYIWKKKVLAALRELSHGTIVVTHWGVINVVVGAALDSPNPLVFRPRYCSVTEVQVGSGSVSIIQLGEEKQQQKTY